jgi:uncharacterized membrane protein (UPF0127 family)
VLLCFGFLARFSLLSLPRLPQTESLSNPLNEATSTKPFVDGGATTTTTRETSSPFSSVRIGSTTITVRVADTSVLRTKGLSGHARLGEREGMLFVFPDIGRFSFWMSDVAFPLDMIWIGPDGRIIGVAQNALPRDPKKPVVYYDPPGPVRFVLEMNAGSYQKFKFATGTLVDTTSILQESKVGL